MTGTIRTYDENVREQVVSGVRLAAEKIAEGAGAEAEVQITKMYPPTVNDEALAARMLPVLKRAADGQVTQALPSGATRRFFVVRSSRARTLRLFGGDTT
jgi:metal-dependent amidase/aminoacylase/carboxypeptidase family protein